MLYGFLPWFFQSIENRVVAGLLMVSETPENSILCLCYYLSTWNSLLDPKDSIAEEMIFPVSYG